MEGEETVGGSSKMSYPQLLFTVAQLGTMHRPTIKWEMLVTSRTYVGSTNLWKEGEWGWLHGQQTVY